MATIQPCSRFIDTYWIIPNHSATPYGKVALTRQDRHTVNSMFKYSRLIWAGRKPVREGPI